ncbi:MAG: YbfB/YjiJ family MFS transporter [Caulobacteraceae bacterium]
MASIHLVASPRQDVARATLCGFCASFASIGLARFAYTPLLPAIIAHGWFAASAAAYLGAANLAGYLVGVVGAGAAAGRFDPRWMLRGAMAVAAVSFFACAQPLGFAWFFAWRLLSGVCGGIAMILAAPTILPHVPLSRRGLASGAIFMGVGVGIAASGALTPLLLRQGLPYTWLGLGGLSLLVVLLGWNGWPESTVPSDTAHPAHRHRRLPSRQLHGLYASYALNAFGLVPHMVFLVDYAARGLGLGLDAGTQYWVLFGLGAIGGPVALGYVADRIGYRTTLRLTFATEAVFVALPALGLGSTALAASSFIVGACTIGVVPVALGRTRELLKHHPSAQAGAWRTATTAFALLQAAGAYALSFVFGRSGGDYRLLFGIGAVAMAMALAVDLFTPEPAKEPV